MVALPGTESLLKDLFNYPRHPPPLRSKGRILRAHHLDIPFTLMDPLVGDQLRASRACSVHWKDPNIDVYDIVFAYSHFRKAYVESVEELRNLVLGHGWGDCDVGVGEVPGADRSAGSSRYAEEESPLSALDPDSVGRVELLFDDQIKPFAPFGAEASESLGKLQGAEPRSEGIHHASGRDGVAAGGIDLKVCMSPFNPCNGCSFMDCRSRGCARGHEVASNGAGICHDGVVPAQGAVGCFASERLYGGVDLFGRHDMGSGKGRSVRSHDSTVEQGRAGDRKPTLHPEPS